MLTRQEIQLEGWRFRYEFDRETTYHGKHETNEHFERGNVWKDDNQGGFLTWYPETQRIEIITTDKGFNMDGPNHSIKYKGICPDLKTLQVIHKLVNVL